MREGEDMAVVAYKDDMALVMELRDSLMLLSGCCHAGLLNTIAPVEWIFTKPIGFITGGLHLLASCADQLQQVSNQLSSKPDLKATSPSQCSGEAAFVKLTNDLGKSVVHPCPMGTVLELEDK